MERVSTTRQPTTVAETPTDPRRPYERPSLTSHGSLALATGGFNLGLTVDGTFLLS